MNNQEAAAPERRNSSYSWLEEFKKRTGRNLRVLHIGNIANNAYNNARIQRRYDIDADVLCYDYYHSMATPEWEDGELRTTVDPSLPDWWSTNLRGFRRPSWFVQGPGMICISYLAARTKGAKCVAVLRRWQLEAAYWRLLEDRARLTGIRRDVARNWRSLFRRYASKLDPWRTPGQSLISLRQSLLDLVLKPLAIAATSRPPVVPGSSILMALWRLKRRLRKLSLEFDREMILGGRTEDEILAHFSMVRIFTNSASILWAACLETLLLISLLPLRLVSHQGRVDWKSRKEINAKVAELIEELRKTEKEVPQVLWDELRQYLSRHALRFSPILSYYDVIQGYSVDGIVPLANGFANFTAYEHGTLRDIPFHNDALGLICRLVYRHAPISFITNSDVIPSAERLGLQQSRLRFLPHAFDDRKLFRFREDNPTLEPPKGYIRFFCPSRHQWKTGEGLKGNDIFLRGAALAAAKDRNFRLTLVEWGQEIGLSKDLIFELQIDDLIEWIQPMGKLDLWRSYCTSHAVADQFVLPALGGVGFEALALGRRLISRIDQSRLSGFFGECPPVMNASSPAEVASALLAVIGDAGDTAGLGKAGKKWIEQFHSAERIVGIQLSAYRSLIEEHGCG
jgi:hypothetical protein